MLIDDFVTYKGDPKWLVKKILSGLKEKMVFDNNLEVDLDRIPTSFVEDCRTLSDMGFVIGGSIALKLYGVLDRDINDFDLFLNERVDFEKLKSKWGKKKKKIKSKRSSIFDLLADIAEPVEKKGEEYDEQRGLIFKAEIDHLLNSDKKLMFLISEKTISKLMELIYK
jgi:hypothetical protein